jgi:hypothetical protein
MSRMLFSRLARWLASRSHPSALWYQRALALPFLGLGGWCVVAPAQVEVLVLQPQFIVGSVTSAVLMACFGAQAVLAGIVVWFSRFTQKAFLMLGLAGSVPFFAFNYYFYFVRPMFTSWMLLDFVGNAAILGLGLAGWRAMRRDDARRSAAATFLAAGAGP